MIRFLQYKIVFFLIINLSISSTFAQNTIIDSLNQELTNAPTHEKPTLFNSLSEATIFSDANTSLSYAGKALEFADETRNEKEFTRSLLNIAEAYFELARYQPAIEYYIKTIDRLTDDKSNNRKIYIHNKIGHCEKLLSNYDNAFTNYQKALNLSTAENNEALKSESLNNIAILSKLKGNYMEAFQLHNKALASANFSGNINEISNTLNYIGSLYWITSKYDSSLLFYEKSLQLKRDINDYLGEALILSNIGVLYKDKGEFQKAIDYHSKSLEIKQRLGNKKEIANSLNNIGSVYLKNNNSDKALEFYNKSLELRLKLDDVSEVAQSQNNIALVYRNQGKFNEALEFFHQSLNNLKKVGNNSLIANCLNQIGSIYLKLNRYDLALENYLNALKLRQEVNDISQIAASLNNIGLIYDEIGNYEKALDYYTQSLSIKSDLADNKELANTLQITGNLFYKQRQFNQALEKYTEALVLREKIGDKISIAASLKSLGNVYLELGDKTKSLIYLKESLRLRDEMGDARGVNEMLNEIGNYYQSISDYDLALDYFLQTIKLSQKTSDKFLFALASRKAGELFIKQGKLNEGLELINNSLEIGQEIGNLEMIKNAYYALFQHYNKYGNKDKALTNYINYSLIKDSIFAKVNDQRILETQMKFEVEKTQTELSRIENEFKELTNEKKIRDLELQKQKNLRNLMIIISLLSLISIILILRQFLLKRKTNRILKEKITEIDRSNKLLRDSESSLKVLNATKDKFFSIIAHDIKNPFNALYSLTDFVSKNFDSYTPAELKNYFDLIHSSAEELLELLENLLHWSRTQRGKIEFNPVNLNLNDKVQSIMSLQKMSADKKNIKIVSSIEPSLYISADEDMLNTILRNLISNAIKFSYPGGVIIIMAEKSSDHTIISVVDSGVGISDEDKEKLFRIDIHYSTTGTSEEIGSGLGLILCREFVEKHNGRIWVESELGKGSTFKFTISNN
jgi:signal transduction histidine kinase/Tfp pilus assembly protein PilF